MSVEIILPVYNEADFLPFFLKHYNWVDKITVLFGYNSTDNSLSILQEDPRVILIDGTEPEGINDQIRIDRINQCYLQSKEDWVIHSDADEFILIDKEYLEKVPMTNNIINTQLVQVYPHISDAPLNIEIPIRLQRRHGTINIHENRPVILRGNCGLIMNIGKHSLLSNNANYYNDKPILVHWQMADKEISINRRINNRTPRLSPLNKRNQWGIHEINNTLENMEKEFSNHLNDLEVIS